VAFEFDRFESSWLQSVENIAKEGVQNTQKYSSLIRTNWNSDWERSGPAGLCRHCGRHSSVASSIGPDQWCVFYTPSFTMLPHAVINLTQIWQIWKPQFRWD